MAFMLFNFAVNPRGEQYFMASCTYTVAQNECVGNKDKARR